jgi:hypothetical protein
VTQAPDLTGKTFTDSTCHIRIFDGRREIAIGKKITLAETISVWRINGQPSAT